MSDTAFFHLQDPAEAKPTPATPSAGSPAPSGPKDPQPPHHALLVPPAASPDQAQGPAAPPASVPEPPPAAPEPSPAALRAEPEPSLVGLETLAAAPGPPRAAPASHPFEVEPPAITLVVDPPTITLEVAAPEGPPTLGSLAAPPQAPGGGPEPHPAGAAATPAGQEALRAALAPPDAAQVRPAAEPRPRRLWQYDVGRLIGTGPIGEVRLAFDSLLRRPVAVKVLRPDLARDEALCSRLVREARLQARVLHPNVVQVLYAGEDLGTTFVATQLLDGGSLARPIESGKRLGWQEAARHMIGAAEGLAAAARLGVIHCNVKPSNILIGVSGEAHLSDFGLCRVRIGAASATAAGDVAAGQPYAAPEQVGAGWLDSRADQYSLGATFYHLLAGRPPFPPGVRRAPPGGEAPRPAPLRSLAPDVPRAFAAAIDRCLEHDRERRFASMEQLAAELRKAAVPQGGASPVARLVAWAIDIAPAAWLLRHTYLEAPWAPFLLLLALTVGSVLLLGATPGMWLMRLQLRSEDDESASAVRVAFRTFLQSGWILLAAGFVHLAYTAAPHADQVGIAAVAWLACVALGSLGALLGRRIALHDRLAGTRVQHSTR